MNKSGTTFNNLMGPVAEPAFLVAIKGNWPNVINILPTLLVAQTKSGEVVLLQFVLQVSL